MKYVPPIVGALLGLLFIAVSSMVLFGNPQVPEIPKDTPPYHFMLAMGPTGYITVVKVLELIGGILTAIPKTRNFGLLILGPIILNILLFHQLVAKDGILNPMLLGISAAALYLLWDARKKFLGLLN